MKKTLLTLGTIALLASPSLFAAEDSLQEHLQMEQKIQKQEQQRLKDGSGEWYKKPVQTSKPIPEPIPEQRKQFKQTEHWFSRWTRWRWRKTLKIVFLKGYLLQIPFLLSSLENHLFLSILSQKI